MVMFHRQGSKLCELCLSIWKKVFPQSFGHNCILILFRDSPEDHPIVSSPNSTMSPTSYTTQQQNLQFHLLPTSTIAWLKYGRHSPKQRLKVAKHVPLMGLQYAIYNMGPPCNMQMTAMEMRNRDFGPSILKKKR